MKEKKNLLLILPLLVFVGTFLIIRALDDKSYAIQSGPNNDVYSDTAEVSKVIKEGTEYKMLTKNTYSWHLITHNFNSFSSTNASGTKLLETTSDIDGYKYKAVVYCATEGKTLSASNKRSRYSLDSANVTTLNDSKKDKLNAVMPYMYPYINLGATSSDENTLKAILKSSDKGLNGTKYNDYDFNSLNVNEAITAAQAAIWNIQKGYTNYYQYRGTITSFSAFSSCNSYYNNKMITSEEKRWYDANGCDSSGNFYKYVYKRNSGEDGIRNRINTLIDWYVNVLSGKLENLGTPKAQYFKIRNKSFTTSSLSFTVDTNISLYDIIITDESKDNDQEVARFENTSDQGFIVSNIPSDVKQVNIEVISKEPSTKPHVFYYIASSGQDFIGLEKTYYTKKINVTLEREEERGKIIIYKVGNKNKNVEVVDNGSINFDATKCESTLDKCLSGAKFELYYKKKTNLIKRVETDYSSSEDLSSVVFDDLPLGIYYLKETQPPEGYDLYNYGVGTSGTDGYVDSNGFIRIELTKSYDGSPIDEPYDGSPIDEVVKAVIVNNNYTKVCIKKVDVDNKTKVLDGAVLEIQDIDGNVIDSFTSNSEEGVICYDGKSGAGHRGRLQSGSYFIKETEAPKGFSIDPNKYRFVVGKANSDISSLTDIGSYKDLTVDNDTYTYTIVNKKGFTMSKSDLTDGACVEGATLTITDSSKNVVTSWTSTCLNDNGEGVDSQTVPVCLTNEEKQALGGQPCLLPGEYTLTEETHPDGYATAESMCFTVKSDGKITGCGDKIDTPVSGDMKDAPIEVCIYKVKKGTKDILTGAEFEVYQQQVCIPENGQCEDKLFHTFVSSEEPCISYYFTPGTYKIVETKAPDGYVLPKENTTTIEIEDKAGKQEFYIENEAEVPKTAIDYSVTVIIIASIFMMFGIGLVGYYEYKKQH